MGRSISKPKSKAEYWHTWHDDHEKGVYKIRDYHTCHITIVRYNKGELDPVTKEKFKQQVFLPTICGMRLNYSWENTYDDHPIYFSSLESAKHHACKKWDLNRAMYPFLNKDYKSCGGIVRKMIDDNIKLHSSGNYNPYAD